jgi:hypothetical protein
VGDLGLGLIIWDKETCAVLLSSPGGDAREDYFKDFVAGGGPEMPTTGEIFEWGQLG